MAEAAGVAGGAAQGAATGASVGGPWGAVIGGVIGAGTAIVQGGKAGEATKEARRDANQAARVASEQYRRATDRSRQILAPFYGTERAANAQLMGQLGLGGGSMTSGGGGATMMGDYGLPGTRDETLDERFIDELQEQIAAGHKQAGRGDSASLQASAKETRAILAEMKQKGELPNDFYIPGENALRGPDRWQQLQAVTTGRWGKSQAYEAGSETAPKYMGMQQGGEAQPGGPGGMPDDSRTHPSMAGPQVQTIQSIQDRAGVVGPGQDFQQQYYDDLSAETPAFGANYTENPVYQAMLDENFRNVNQGAANTGSLYSGRRGEALREASAATQFGMYQDLADREQRAYEMDLNRRGDAVRAGQGREDAYYNNYMTMLQNLQNPTTATNLANVERGLAAEQGRIGQGAALQANAYNLAGTAAENQMYADVATGLGEIVQGFSQ